MKRLSFLICVASITFGLGVGVMRSYAGISKLLTTAKPVRSKSSSSEPRRAERVQIKLQRAYRDKGVLLTEFKVTNGSREILSYMGYGKSHNSSWGIMRGNRSEWFSPSCGTGLEGHSLYTGDSATFSVALDEPGDVRVGFEFLIGEKRQTIWSEGIIVPEP